jgi:N-methylhydantoinase A
MLLSDLKHDFVRTCHGRLSRDGMDAGQFAALVNELGQEGRRVLLSENIPPDRHHFVFSLDLRYLGQYHEVNVEVGANLLKDFDVQAIKAKFHQTHDRLYGYSLAEEGTGVELVNLRLTAVGITDKPSLRREKRQKDDATAWRKGERPVYLPSERKQVPVEVYDGDRMGHGNRLTGPAIVEQVNTTILLPPGWDLECDTLGSYVMSWQG